MLSPGICYWRLHPDVVEIIWQRYGEAEVDLFASELTAHCPMWFARAETSSLLGQDALAHEWPRCLLYAFPPFPLLWETLHRILLFRHRVLLVAPRWPARPWFPLLLSLLQGEPWQLLIRQDVLSQVHGSCVAPRSSSPSALFLATGSDLLLTDCEPAVINTIDNARAPSTGAGDCSPLGAAIIRLIRFIVQCRKFRFSYSTCWMKIRQFQLRVYVAAISAYHAPVDGFSLGSHALICKFLKGAVRLKPVCATPFPVWDLPLVLDFLCSPPFEPLEVADVKWLSFKAAFLLSIASAKRVGELHALSVSESCLHWLPEDSGVILWPNPAFLPKVLSPQFVNQSLHLAAF